MNSNQFKIQVTHIQNKNLAVNKSNAQHDEIKARVTIAQRSNALYLNNMNMDVLIPDVC